MKVVLLLLVVLLGLMVLNHRYVTSFPPQVTILQVEDTARASSDLLLEKQPIVMSLAAGGPQAIDGFMRYMYMYARRHDVQGSGTKHLCGGAFTAIVPHQGTTLSITPPQQQHFVDVRLSPDRALVLPFRWSYSCAVPHTRVTYHNLAHALAGGDW